ncbi:hypothetical protein Ae706Ps2_2446c [Pseudonocardia sp. Ae706_Ps2]|nr:hypothetical protein Ae505Ps2_2852 [Pseudonocardia sp. Ae505_Ps2]OLM24013.1 hypothetical protein Ae706Ps2_2446c [Pseudonocardia sp. Ae706_Ps2]
MSTGCRGDHRGAPTEIREDVVRGTHAGHHGPP